MQTEPVDDLRGLSIVEAASNPASTFVKGSRRNRPFTDSIFTWGMSIYSSFVLCLPLWDINAQPSHIPREFFYSQPHPSKDYSLDVFYYALALSSGLNMQRFTILFGRRLHGISHWNTDLIAKILLILRTAIYICRLRCIIWRRS